MGNIQAVIDFENIAETILKRITTGSSISVEGELVSSQGAGQAYKIQASTIAIIGDAQPDEVQKTVLQPKKHSFDFLREQAHLKVQNEYLWSGFRIRHAASFAIHQFFNNRGFNYIHTPILTGSDAEGAEMFRVSTLDPKSPPLDDEGKVDFSKDFFGKQVNLTVSGQLEAELAALGLGKVYTFDYVSR